MANGQPGDHPMTDINFHGDDDYGPDISAVVNRMPSKYGAQASTVLLVGFLRTKISGRGG